MELKLGIVVAQSEEYDPLVERLENLQKIKGDRCFPGFRVFVCKSGVGMTNAMLATTNLIYEYGVDYVLNIGVASVRGNYHIGDILRVSLSFNGDFDISVFNHPKYYVPEVGNYIDISKQGISTILGIPCFSVSSFSGDNIDTPLREYLIDMEYYGVAHACGALGVPCSAIKAVSDKGEKDNHLVYNDYLDIVCEGLADYIITLLQNPSIFPGIIINNMT